MKRLSEWFHPGKSPVQTRKNRSTFSARNDSASYNHRNHGTMPHYLIRKHTKSHLSNDVRKKYSILNVFSPKRFYPTSLCFPLPVPRLETLLFRDQQTHIPIRLSSKNIKPTINKSFYSFFISLSHSKKVLLSQNLHKGINTTSVNTKNKNGECSKYNRLCFFLLSIKSYSTISNGYQPKLFRIENETDENKK